MKDKVVISRISQLMKPEIIFIAMAGFMIFTQLFAIGAFSYLGIFNRFIADDYCESVAVRDEFLLSAVFNRYVEGEFRSADRYSNLLFVGLSELLGKYHYQILSSIMMLIWLVGLIWSMTQFRKLAGIRMPILLGCLAVTSIVFFSVWQAPNRYQIFLWRSGMATHFAPLVFISLLVAFILTQINSRRRPALWVCLLVFLSSFLVGGFSEPPTTFMIVALLMLIPVVWSWEPDVKRRSALTLLTYSLAGFLLAFIAMFFSPGNVSHGNASISALPAALAMTFRFTFNFLDDSVSTLPIPSLISIVTSFLISFVFFLRTDNEPLTPHRRRQIWIWLMIAPVIQYLLIAASFAPSAYGQSYPAERAQILGRLIMTATFLLEGALLGVLCAHSRVLIPWRRAVFLLGSLGFLILAFYPLRAGMIILTEVPEYRQWASAWDLREIEINHSIDMGERDLVVRILQSKDGVKEIDAATKHWVNRCAAQYYEVDSIYAVQMGDQ